MATPIYDQAQPTTLWLEHKGKQYALQFWQGQMRVLSNYDDMWHKVYEDDLVMELVSLARSSTSSPAMERLERMQRSLRELVTLWTEAPSRAKWLIVGLDGDINGCIAEIAEGGRSANDASHSQGNAA